MMRTGQVSEAAFRWGAFFFFCLLFAAIFPDVIFFENTFFRRDIFRYYYPVWQLCVDSMRQGVFPLWNPYVGFGQPLLGAGQTLTAHPASLFFYLPDFVRGLNLFILFHLVLCGFTTLLWMRTCGASRMAALLSGASFALCGFTLSAINLTISLVTAAYIPLVFLCVKKLILTSDPRWVPLTAISLYLQYAGGDPYLFYATALMIALYLTFFLLRAGAQGASAGRMGAVRLICAYVLSLAMISFQLLPFCEFAFFFSERNSKSLEYAAQWGLRWLDSVTFIVPHFSDVSLYFMRYADRQSWLENWYSGIVVFVLAYSAWKARKFEPVRGHLFLGLVSLLLSLGTSGILFSVFFRTVPFFSFMHYPVRYVVFVNFAIACLAGFGFDAVRISKKKFTRITWPSLMLFLGGSACAFLLLPMQERIVAWAWPILESWTRLEWRQDQVKDCLIPVLSNIRRGLLMATFASIVLWCAKSLRIGRALAFVFFLVLLIADLGESNVIEFRIHKSWLSPQTPAVQTLASNPGFYRVGATLNMNVYYDEPPSYDSVYHALYLTHDAMMPNVLLPHRVHCASAYDSLYIKESDFLSGPLMDPRYLRTSQLADLLNVRYVVSMAGEDLSDWKKVQPAGIGNLMENPDVLPRAFLVDHAVSLEPAEALKKMLSSDFKPKETVFLDEPFEPAAPIPLSRTDDLGGKVEITDYSLNGMSMAVQTPVSKWLFLSDAYYPGWSVRINGIPAKIHRANYCFRAVMIPAGKSSVEWKYEPFLFRIGVLLSLVAWAGCLWMLIKSRSVRL